jgi:hypothetical protein
MIFEEELTENIIKHLQIYQKHIVIYAVYISQLNLTFKNL